MYNKFRRGSEWRRWDLHVHTKGTNKNDQFESSDFLSFCTTMFKKAIAKEIAVIGITDYFSIDRYNEVLKFQKDIDSNDSFTNEEQEKVKAIFLVPNIELRMLPVTDSGRLVNIHCIINPSYVANLEHDFLSKIHYTGSSGNYSMNRSGIVRLGQEMDSKLTSDDERYKIGVNNFVVNHAQLKELFDTTPTLRNNIIVIVSNSNKDGASGLQKHYELFENSGSLDAVRKSLYNLCDCIFSSNEEDRNYFAGKKKDKSGNIIDIATVIDSCGSLKPCIHGSDAHKEEDLFNPAKDRFCWIKADPTFEGLKQIMLEPEERVKIQNSNPNDEKLLYNVIEKVRFIDNSSQKKFPNSEIDFNPNLNAIIGGKSSGKSLLMHMIAGAIGNRTDSKNYSDILKNIDIEVFYADNIETKVTSEDRRIVEFLPQQHIESIVKNKSEISKNSNEKTRHFNTFIEELIRQDKEIELYFTSHQETIKRAVAKINENVTKWISFDRDFTQAKKELQPLGDKAAINGEIIRIGDQITVLTQNAGLTEEELLQYTQLTTSNKDISAEVTRLEAEKAELLKLLSYATNDILQYIKQSLRFETNSSITLELYNKFILELPDLIQPKIDSFIAEIKVNGKEVITNIETNHRLIAENIKLLEPLLNKNKIQIELKTLETSRAVEKAKLATIEGKETQIGEIKTQRDTVDFITEYANIIDSYTKLKDSINSRVATLWGESNANLTLTANSIFDSSLFAGAIGAPINLKSQLETQFEGSGFNATEYAHSDEKHISNINRIIKKCTADEDRFNNFKGAGNSEELLRAILKDCFYIDYDIKKGSDSLQNMSEGKKGIVILQLYLSLSKADCPILIDQPEDNLDNRTVYKELNDYIKRSKQRRQIIMVSHNANLVVNTDAENVIVANQSGEDGKDNKEFRFEYVNGALENTSPLDDTQKGVLYQQGIREHVCEILEGGTDAFRKREEKYQIRKQL